MDNVHSLQTISWTPKEDVLIYKVVGCIPVIGVIVTLFKESTLAAQFGKGSTAIAGTKAIRLIEVKNHYKIASIIRESIFIALIAILMAVGILKGSSNLAVGACSITVLFVVIGVHTYKLVHNKKVIEELRANPNKTKTFSVK